MSVLMNVNQSVRVKLTVAGIDQFYTSHEKCLTTEQITRLLEAAELVDGRHEFSLHELMKIFGEQMYAGNPRQMFEHNQIELFPANT